MEEEKFYTIILRHDESTQWMINNPILALGEYGVEDDTHRIKRGDGNTKWADLSYEHFGLEFLVTYANLQGKVSDNTALQEALNDKVSYEMFADIKNALVAGITITSVDGKIGMITKTTKDISTGSTKLSKLLIQSDDQSIQGLWSVDDAGMRILNLKANAAIDDYTPTRTYYEDQICFYNNKLYRAIANFEASSTFNPDQWVVLASLHSNDIKYDNKISGLEAMTVKEALDELQDLDSTRLKMTKRENKVYGTNEDGQQFLYDKDELRTVDSVNGIRAANQEAKNIQIDANNINYDDKAGQKETIKEKLDQKVDKTILGEGNRVVRDLDFTYDEDTGALKLIEDKVSLEDGSQATEEINVNIASNKELNDAKVELNTKIDNEVSTLNTKIDNEVETLNNTINEEVETLNNTINTNKTDIETKLKDTETKLKRNIDINDNEINARVNNEVSTLDTKIDQEVETLNTTISDNKQDIETKLKNAQDTLQQNIDVNKQEINARVDSEVAALDKTISDNKIEINDKVNANKEELNNKIDANKRDIESKLETGLDKKIDKDIADSLVSGIEISTEIGEKLDEPTLKITSKNTDTKTTVVHHLHFVEKGDIELTKENDHIVVDSSVIDMKVRTNTSTIENHSKEIASLQVHDTNHDKILATHTEQIANHETRVLGLEERADNTDTEIAKIKETHSNDINAVKTVNANQEAHLTRIDQTLDDHDERIQENADSIVETNKNVSLNLEKINNLEANKVDRIFSKAANDKIAGDILLNELTTNDIANVSITDVNPVDNTSNKRILTLKSTDNTLVSKAITDEAGNITGYDLATNLDIDVNYFVTTEILNTTIPSENTVSLNSLTATDKTEVELHDIISDSEGTWSRVKSIDKENGTCVTVTYAKHAQAIWGTVKGNIDEQQDLKEKLDTIDTKIQNVADDRFQRIQINQYGGSEDKYLVFYKAALNGSYDVGINGATGSGINVEYSTAPLSKRSIYLKLNLDIEQTAFDSQQSGLKSTKLSNAIRELKSLDNEKVLITDFDTFKTTNEAKLNTKAESVNGITVDDNSDILIKAENIPYDNTQVTLETLDNSSTDVQAVLNNVLQDIDVIVNTFNVTQLVWSLDILSKEPPYTNICPFKNGDFITGTSDNGVVLMAKIKNIDHLDNPIGITDQIAYIKNGVINETLELVGIPEQIVETHLTIEGVMPQSLFNEKWSNTNVVTFKAYDNSEETLLASADVRRSDLTPIADYKGTPCVGFNLIASKGQTLDSLQQNIGTLKVISSTSEQESTYTCQFLYDSETKKFYADRFPA